MKQIQQLQKLKQDLILLLFSVDISFLIQIYQKELEMVKNLLLMIEILFMFMGKINLKVILLIRTLVLLLRTFKLVDDRDCNASDVIFVETWNQ